MQSVLHICEYAVLRLHSRISIHCITRCSNTSELFITVSRQTNHWLLWHPFFFASGHIFKWYIWKPFKSITFTAKGQLIPSIDFVFVVLVTCSSNESKSRTSNTSLVRKDFCLYKHVQHRLNQWWKSSRD